MVNAAASQTCFFTVVAAEDDEGLVCLCSPSVFKLESAIKIMLFLSLVSRKKPTKLVLGPLR